MIKHDKSSLWILLVGATIISFSPVFVKIAANGNIGPTAIGCWRTGIGAVPLILYALFSGRSLLLSRQALFYSCLAGFFFFLDLFFWHRSIIFIGAGMATILANTQIFAATMLSYFFFRERVTVRFMFAATTAFAGVALLVGLGSDAVEFNTRYLTGIIYGLATGLSYASALICIKKGHLLPKKPDPISFMIWFCIATTFISGIASFIEGESFMPSDTTTILSLLGLGLLVHAVGWLAITSVIPKVKVSQAGLILLLQPVLAMLWGYSFFSEQLVLLQFLGAVVTLAAMYIGSSKNNNSRKTETME